MYGRAVHGAQRPKLPKALNLQRGYRTACRVHDELYRSNSNAGGGESWTAGRPPEWTLNAPPFPGRGKGETSPPIHFRTLPAVDRCEEVNEPLWSLRRPSIRPNPALGGRLGRGLECCCSHEPHRLSARQGEAHVYRGHWEPNKQELTGVRPCRRAPARSGPAVCLALP